MRPDATDVIQRVTKQIIERSKPSRTIYLERIKQMHQQQVERTQLSCSNLAHVMAPCSEEEKHELSAMQKENIGIVTAYNDMLSAHQPFATYPPLIKRTLAQLGVTAQVAGGVPAMCDGVTQSQPGMELSLFSRDVIAHATAVALSHNVFDGAILLGVCDKIVPGMFIGAMKFGHLPMIFAPAGPMPSGISNAQKAKVRQEYAKGNISRDELLNAEAASYHSAGTCTFYGTANSNQMLMEIMGLHLPGASFINANTPLRELLTQEAAHTVVQHSPLTDNYLPIGQLIDEKSFVNAIIGLMSTGGSTNLTIHLIAMAKSAGIVLTWDDFDAISHVTPLLCKMYPNGSADVNHFHAAGGMALVIRELLAANILHEEVATVAGFGLSNYLKEPFINDNALLYKDAPIISSDTSVISSTATPFSEHGGLKVLNSTLGRSVIKTSALKDELLTITAPAKVFYTQEALKSAFENGALQHDFIAVIPFQGPKANGMPELHGLMPSMGALQDEGYNVAILTDGRMSGASGKVASAIHLSPEAADDGLIKYIQDGDIITIDAIRGVIEVNVSEEALRQRTLSLPDFSHYHWGVGRELFEMFRATASSAETGACNFSLPGQEQ